jgi:hypothetical protein
MRRALPLLLLPLAVAACAPPVSRSAGGTPAPPTVAGDEGENGDESPDYERVENGDKSPDHEPPTPTPIATTRPSPTPTSDPARLVNGVPVARFVVMPPEVIQNVRAIYARGQALGRNAHAFSKVGDSISESIHYFALFDWGDYDLGRYAHLQPAIDHYRGSFARAGPAVRSGARAADVLRPGLADAALCRADEHRLACEFRLHNPGVALIRLGTNDAATPDADYERAIREVIAYSLNAGVIPVLVTKSDRAEGEDDRHNATLRALAAEYAIPLWDYDAAAATLPDRGLSGDGLHLTMYGSDDYTDPAALAYGYPLSDLTGLFALDAIRRAVDPEGTP